MTISIGKATWEGTLKEGNGTVELGKSGIFKGPFTHASRFINGPGDGKTNPEELIGAAHAGCYAMFLSALLTNNGTPPIKIDASSSIKLGEGPTITAIKLRVSGEVPGVDRAKFEELAKEAKEKCPVSKALGAVEEMLLEIDFQ